MAAACTAGIDTGFVELGYAKVAALGVVQGVSELMPISSTAHMRIVPALLGWRDPGSAFSAAMQAAALVAVIAYFWSDVRGLVFGSLGALVRRDFKDWNLRFAIWIVLATIPIVIAGVLLSPVLNACNTPLRSLPVIGISMITLAVILAIAEFYCDHSRTFDQLNLKDAMIVGIAQVGALIPGVSRSGSTLTAALFRDLNREDAARFSFLLGLPAIAGAGLKEFHELWKAHLDLHGWL
ncbi:MAG: undecaprenyl-diphosphate phosphatase, partial [Hyphomicrobiales bacterium]|nr:undecaprenyl-diphosphate phosphatase [Hyphomicrobiales bacterium]